MRVLVTGASGFLGSHIVDECLRFGDEVRVLVRPGSDLGYLRTVSGIDFYFGDVTDYYDLRAACRGIDIVQHSAARVDDSSTRRQFWDVNVAGTENLLRAAQENSVKRFVFVSSPGAVMAGEDQIDVDESVEYPEQFLNLHSETKAVAEQAVLAANSTTFMTCALRPRGIWGPRDRRGFMPRLVANLLAGKLPDLSGGRTVHTSLCYCRNAAQACVLASRSNRVAGNAYFVADRERTDIWRLLSDLGRLFGAPPMPRKVCPALRDTAVNAAQLLRQLPVLAARSSPPVTRCSPAVRTKSGNDDTQDALRDFGYRPEVDQLTGLRLLVDWVAEIGGVAEFVREVR